MHKKLQINDNLIAFTTRLSTINTLSKSSILQITFKPLKKIQDIPLTFINNFYYEPISVSWPGLSDCEKSTKMFGLERRVSKCSKKHKK